MNMNEEQAKKYFDMVDTDNNGSLSIGELKSFLQKSIGSTDSEIEELFDRWNKDDDDKITKEEFVEGMAKKDRSKAELKAEIKKKFAKYDKDGSGKLTLDELRNMVGELEFAGDLQKYLEKVDTDKDGKVSLEEFLKFMSRSEEDI